MSEECWDLTAHIRGAISEALVAKAVHQKYSDAVLHSPRHRGFDVSSEEGGLRVDAKVASILEVDLDGIGDVVAVEWDSGSRSDLLHQSATHLGLVVLDEAHTYMKLFDGANTVLQGEGAVHGRVFLVPSVVAREEAVPIWSKRNGRPSKGRFRYLRLEAIARYECEWRFNV